MPDDTVAAAPAPAPAPDPASDPASDPAPDTPPPAPVGDPPPGADEWQAVGAELAAEQTAREAGLAALRQDWGEAFDANVALAQRLASEVAAPELVAALDRSGLAGDPFLLRAVAEVARRLYGGSPTAAPAGGREAERLRGQLDELHALQFHDDPRERESYRSPTVQSELARLYAALYGDAPVVGRDLRVA